MLPIVYKRLAEEWCVHVTHDDCIEYGRSVGTWPAFEDSPGALQYLKKYFKLVILSNVDNESFQASNRRLQVEFDAIYTAEHIGSYKPSRRNFDYMIEKLGEIGVKEEKILHTAESMFHDHKPANEHGLKSCWIYRRHAQEGFGASANPGQIAELNVTCGKWRRTTTCAATKKHNARKRSASAAKANKTRKYQADARKAAKPRQRNTEKTFVPAATDADLNPT